MIEKQQQYEQAKKKSLFTGGQAPTGTLAHHSTHRIQIIFIYILKKRKE